MVVAQCGEGLGGAEGLLGALVVVSRDERLLQVFILCNFIKLIICELHIFQQISFKKYTLIPPCNGL